MDETKYGKYITYDCTRVPRPDRDPIYSTRHLADWGGSNRTGIETCPYVNPRAAPISSGPLRNTFTGPPRTDAA
jgi:hypothetical protein